MTNPLFITLVLWVFVGLLLFKVFLLASKKVENKHIYLIVVLAPFLLIAIVIVIGVQLVQAIRAKQRS